MKTAFPTNPAASLLLAEIGTMLHVVPTDTFVGLSIWASIQQGMPIKRLVQELSEQIQDNRRVVSECIGIRLVEKIEKYKMINI